MGKLKSFLVTVFMTLAGTALYAKQITFQVVQHDLSSKNVTEQSLIMEDCVINSFFENGFIVTNSLTVTASSEAEDKKHYDDGIGEAFNGYSDIFIQIKVFYFNKKDNLINVSDVEKIDWTISNAKTGIKLLDKSISDLKPITKKSDMNELSNVIATEILKSYKSL